MDAVLVVEFSGQFFPCDEGTTESAFGTCPEIPGDAVLESLGIPVTTRDVVLESALFLLGYAAVFHFLAYLALQLKGKELWKRAKNAVRRMRT